jgi:hypothetical protein
MFEMSFSMIPSCTKTTLLCEVSKVKGVRAERVPREEKSESTCVGGEGIWDH